MRLSSLFTGIFAAALAMTAMSASAFERPFPPIAKRGEMRPAPHPEIIINNKQRLLSAGARIWNTDNLIEMPASLRSGKYAVNYTETPDGEIDRVWMLTADEARQLPPNRK